MDKENTVVLESKIWDNYQKLTPKNQRRFKNELMEGMGITTKNHIYNILHARVSISPITAGYIDDLFKKFYRQQIESTQL